MIGLSLLITGLIIKPKQLIAEDVVPKELMVYTKNDLIQLTYKYAEIYNVNPKTMLNIINCENTEWDIDLQSRIINKKGIREESYGLSQIHLPSHPDISKEQATDPDFALEFMAKNISKGKISMWSCARIKKLY